MYDSKLKELCKHKSSDLSRNSPLNFVNLILIFLNNQGLSNTLELKKFFKKIGKTKVTKEAFSQARLKLKPLVFKKLNWYHLKMFHENEAKKEFKGYSLLAVDGFKIKLPFHKILIKIFGGIKNKFNVITSCAGNSSIVYDVLNHFIIDFELDAYKTSEKTLLRRNLKNIFQIKWLKKMKKSSYLIEATDQ
jgi:hypothetical protein